MLARNYDWPVPPSAYAVRTAKVAPVRRLSLKRETGVNTIAYCSTETVPRVCVTGFKIISDFHRLLPCCFVVVDPVQPVRTEESLWMHTRFWIAWLICIGISYLVSSTLNAGFKALPPIRHFNLNLFGFFVYGTLLEGYINASTMRTRRALWVEIIKCCERVESRIQASRKMVHKAQISARFVLLFQLVIFVCNASINAINDFGMGIWSYYGIGMPPLIRVFSYAVSLVCGIMIPTNGVLAKVWMIYFGQLFVSYIQRMNEVSCGGGRRGKACVCLCAHLGSMISASSPLVRMKFGMCIEHCMEKVYVKY